MVFLNLKSFEAITAGVSAISTKRIGTLNHDSRPSFSKKVAIFLDSIPKKLRF